MIKNIFEKISCFMFLSSRWRKGVIDAILLSGGFEQTVIHSSVPCFQVIHSVRCRGQEPRQT